jgi:pimeloyl-ACP methyl ester carboxylesterase
VAGLGDEVTHADFHSFRLHEAVPHSHVVTVEGAGHQIIFSHPTAVLVSLDDLLARIQAGSPAAEGH